jgi:hypothetical protein
MSSQIAPEKLCSISTYEPDEVKSENAPSEYVKKETSEKLSDNEESQFQDKLSKKKKKRKKEKQEHGMELNIEESEDAPQGKGKEGDTSLKKCKRKKMEGVETEVEARHSQAEDDSMPPKKKKRRKNEESGVEGTEGNTDIVHEGTAIIHQSCETETCLEKKRRKVKDVGETALSEHQQVSSDTDPEVERVVKGKETKAGEWDEEVVDEVGPEVGSEEEGAADVVKKKIRKRRKKHVKDKQDIEASQLQILPKYVIINVLVFVD